MAILGRDKRKSDVNRIQNLENINKAISKQEKNLNDILSLSKKEVFQRKDEVKELQKKLARNYQILESNFKNLSLTSKQYYLTKKQKEELEKINAELIKEEEKREGIQKQLGVFGGVLKGLEKIPVLRNLGIDFKKIREEAENATEKTKSGVKGLGAGVKELGSQLKSSLTNPANIALFVMQQMWVALKNVDKATGDLAKSFNMTYVDASNLREELIQMGNRSGDIAINARALQESMIAVGNSLSSNAVLNEKDLITFTKLREQAGFTNEELTEMQKLTSINGGNLEDNVGNLLVAAKTTSLNNKVLLNEKTIMSEVAKTSKAIQLSLGGSGRELGKAVAQVKALGMNMQQVENIAGSLLDFESSISAELEAELLTGKDLNLERARLYAINNDMAGVAREINKQFGSAAEFSHMNRIQQEAAAKAVGMNREELARTLTDQEALRDISADQVGKAQEALNAARDRGMTEEQIREKTIEDLMSQQSIQERLNNTTEKLQEIFVNIAQPLMPLLDGLATVLELVGYILKPLEWMNKYLGMIGESISKLTGPLGTVGKIMKTIAGVAVITAAYKAYSSLASYPFVGAAMGATAAAGILLAGFGVINKIKDGKVNGKKGLIASGEFGSVQLNEKDKAFWNGQELIAGTDLLGKGKRSSNQNNMQEIKMLRAEMRDMANRPIIVQSDIQLDGKSVAKGLGREHANTFFTQAGPSTRLIA